jgi:hypothetical protein
MVGRNAACHVATASAPTATPAASALPPIPAVVCRPNDCPRRWTKRSERNARDRVKYSAALMPTRAPSSNCGYVATVTSTANPRSIPTMLATRSVVRESTSESLPAGYCTSAYSAIISVRTNSACAGEMARSSMMVGSSGGNACRPRRMASQPSAMSIHIRPEYPLRRWAPSSPIASVDDSDTTGRSSARSISVSIRRAREERSPGWTPPGALRTF